jgi:hypothetical protein
MVIGWLESELRFFLPTNRRLGAAVSVAATIVYIKNGIKKNQVKKNAMLKG